MEVVDRPDPGAPGPGEVVVRPQVVGICGSDFHIFLGELGSSFFPRIQGHELCAVVDEVGPGCEGVEAGDRVAVWPIVPCGECYPCTIGREAVCSRIRILGVHFDGGLQHRLRLPVTQVVPVGDLEPEVVAMIEPVSIAVRTVARARIEAGEHVVVLGAGPIGQAVALVARERGATVLLVDRISSRLERGKAIGAETLESTADSDVVAFAREWAGGTGPPVVVDATGAPAAIRSTLDIVTWAGRVVIAGISHLDVSLPIGAFTAKELDVLGTSCCTAEEFREAARIVAACRADVQRLITHEFPLERAPEAIVFAIENPAEVMKVVVRLPDAA
jgi:L-gulonate 5-dehydrogenase